jgi:hypothetical protein
VMDLCLFRLPGTDLHEPNNRPFRHLLRNRRPRKKLHSITRFNAECSPQHVAWYEDIRNLRFKKTIRGLIPYLDKHDLLLSAHAPNSLTQRESFRHDHCHPDCPGDPNPDDVKCRLIHSKLATCKAGMFDESLSAAFSCNHFI